MEIAWRYQFYLLFIGIEVYTRCSFCARVSLERCSGRKAKPSGVKIIGKSTDSRIILLHCPIVVVTSYFNAVFSTFQLSLQTAESIVGAQVRVVLCYHQQPS